MADSVRPAAELERIGRYEVVGHLATGGMAEILLGRIVGPSGFERPVVIKRILSHLVRDGGFSEMFLDEARLVARIRHPNVVQVQELAREGDTLFLVMEYLEGESVAGLLRRHHARRREIEPGVAALIIADACAGLHAAHELTDEKGESLGLVHRDVSPQNIFLTYQGLVKVIDFGIAKATGRIARTDTGTVKGKMTYMSPEQCLGDPLDRRSDVFSLGIVLFELCTTRRLFVRDNPLLTFKAICEDPIPNILDYVDDVPNSINRICQRALTRDRSARYSTAKEMRLELLEAVRELDLSVASEDELAHLMDTVFPDRIEEKRALLGRMRSDQAVVSVPEAETDIAVTIPVVASSRARRLAEDAEKAAEPPAPTRARRYMWLAVPAVVGALLAARTLAPGAAPRPLQAQRRGFNPASLLSGSSNPSSSPSSSSSPKHGAVSLRFETVPAGAVVYVDDARRGTTPTTVEVPLSSQQAKVELRLNGYHRHLFDVLPDVNQRFSINLRPAAGRPPPVERSTGTDRSPPPSPTAGPEADDFHRFE